MVLDPATQDRISSKNPNIHQSGEQDLLEKGLFACCLQEKVGQTSCLFFCLVAWDAAICQDLLMTRTCPNWLFRFVEAAKHRAIKMHPTATSS